MHRTRFTTILLAVLVASLPALAQQSASFKLAEHVLNAAGHPEQGAVFTSTSFRVSLDAVGDSLSAPGLASSSFRVDGGFVPAYRPPGEITDLVFTGPTSLAWSGEPAAVRFNLYRGTLTSLPGDFGTCRQSSLATPSATETAAPPTGVAWFYLVTGENRLREEGTKGFSTGGAERPNSAPCP